MLDPSFLAKPLAHRGMWNSFRPENSLSAISAAVDAGFGVEIDVQISSDDKAMVFHDDTLKRMTDQKGWVSDYDCAELCAINIGEDDTIPTLPQALEVIAGRVPVLIELKDQSQRPGGKLGPLEARVIRDLAGYSGPLAVMSFHPVMVANLAKLAPGITRGITGMKFDPELFGTEISSSLNGYNAFKETGSSFVSHHWRDLEMEAIADLKAAGVPILCWTVRAQAEQNFARKIADNVTFEGYRPE